MTATAPLLSERYGRLSNLPLRPRQVSPSTSQPLDRRHLAPVSALARSGWSRVTPFKTSATRVAQALQEHRRGARRSKVLVADTGGSNAEAHDRPGRLAQRSRFRRDKVSSADRRSLATTDRLSPTSAGNSCSTGAIEGKRLVKSCPLCRGNRESPEQMSGAPGGDAPLLSCARDEGISLAFGTKPGGGSSLGLWQRTSASKVSPMALGLRISEATNWGSLVPRQASAAL